MLAPGEVGGLLLLYNVLGFAMQPVVGWLVDRGRWSRLAVLVGLAAQAGALVFMGLSPWLAVALTGLGSAVFHVGAGSLALGETPGRATGVGLFAAPGVLGLGIGGALAVAGIPASPGWLIGLLVVLGWLAFVLPHVGKASGRRLGHASDPPRHPVFEAHDLWMIGLLAAIALRSLVWTALNWIVEGQSGSLLALAAAAALGKAVGGVLADRFGWRRWTLTALVGAAFLTGLGPRNAAAACLSAALLQSATPAAVAALLTWLPGRPALAAGLAFGLAIALGGAPFAVCLGSSLLSPPLLAVALAGAALLSIGFLISPFPRRALLIPSLRDTGAGFPMYALNEPAEHALRSAESFGQAPSTNRSRS
jgi:FSR family fosmidomycin resistance protein-like MFS transporter